MGDYFLQQVVNALSAGSLYALMAVGLAMVFGILRLINFAHGDLMMIAAYLAAFSLGAGLPLAVAIPIMVAGTVLVALLMERIAYRPIRGAPDVAMLLSSFAVGQILQNGTLLTTRIAGAVLGGYVLGVLEVLATALTGIGDLLPPGSVPDPVREFLQHWLPSSLASYRDAFVFVALILVLLVRPQGILGRRDREESL